MSHNKYIEKIVIVSTYFFPEKNAAANRLFILAESLSKSCRVRVYTAAEDPQEARSRLEELDPPFSVEYSQKKFFAVGNYAKRFFREFVQARRIFRSIDFSEPSTIIISVPSIFIVPLFFGKAKRHRIILDVRDLQWEYLLNQDNPFSKMTGLLFKKLVLAAAGGFQLISVTNAAEYRYFAEQFPDKRLVHVSNGIDRNRFERIREALSRRDEKKAAAESSDTSLPTAPAAQQTVSYVGNVGKLQNLEPLLRIAARMPKTRFIIAGGGGDLERIQAIAGEQGLNNVEFTGYIEWERVLEIYRRSDVLYARLDPAYFYAVPSKLYEYLSTGLPVVYEGEGAAADFLAHFERVCVASNGEFERLLSCFDMALKYGGLCGENVEKIRSNYLRETIFEDFKRDIESEIERNSMKRNSENE